MEDCTPVSTPVARISTIYALLDADGNVRYVGITAFSLAARLKIHMKEANRGKKTHKCNWLRSLSEPPPIVAIEETYDRDREIYWIAYYRAHGASLTNSTDGGQGTPGAKSSEETKAKIGALTRSRFADEEYRQRCGQSISAFYLNGGVHHNQGKHHSEETRAKIKAAHVKRYSDPDERAKLSARMIRGYADGTIKKTTGRKLSDFQIQRLRQANCGKKLSPESICKRIESCRKKREQGYVSPLIGRVPSQETRNKISAANKGKIIGPEYRAKLSAAAKGRVKSVETLRKISESHKRKYENGHVNHFAGKSHSEETRAKMRASSALRWAREKAEKEENAISIGTTTQGQLYFDGFKNSCTSGDASPTQRRKRASRGIAHNVHRCLPGQVCLLFGPIEGGADS